MPVNYSLYLVTDRDILRGRDLVAAVADAIRGGVTLVQLREKDITSREFYELAVTLKKVVNAYKVPLIVNDRLDIALAADADGLHIGQKDLPLVEARRLLGPGKLLGYSVKTIEQAVYGEKKGADYLGAGAVFETGSKADAGKPIGLATLCSIKAAVSLPVVGIGGINAENASAVKRSGADGVSVISAILGHEDVAGAARDLLRAFNSPADSDESA